ncbi:dynein regulatory complex protein 9 [Diachasma alloeum]|uniref:dynein regulatory complex protein 9 n=1 Tax=Diachasma alloeum TaxID=454923 RepID=UPI00073850FB|nr:dynein regulatory complex protein 9 [Diachasma alloeum]
MEQIKNEEEKELRRTMESGKVMFEIPVNLNIDQKLKSSIALRGASGDHPDRSDEIASLRGESTKIEELAKKSSSIFTRTSAKPSKQRLGDVGQYDEETLKEIEARRKTIFASRSDLSRVSSVFFKAMKKANEKGLKSRNSSQPSAELSRKSSSRLRLSDNIPVRSMILEIPRRVDLNPEEADAYGDVIERVLNQLELIRYRIPAEVDERWDEDDQDFDEKYDVPEEPAYSLREYLGLPPLIPIAAEKLQRDRTYIYNVLKEMLDELREYRRYDRLEYEIEKIAKTTENEHNLEVNHEIWTEQVDQLVALIESERLDSEIEVRKWISGVHESAADIDDAIFLSKSKLGYVRGWESVRLEGQRLRLEMQEQNFQDQLSDYDRKEGAEEVVSEELRAYLQQEINKMEAAYGKWMTLFNDEIDQLDEEIEYKKQDIEEAERQLERNTKLSRERQEFIDDCVTRRKVMAEEKAYWDAIHRAAAVIQALWRGCMVRRQLGPYRGLRKALKKRKKMAAKRRKKMEARRRRMEEKKAAEEAKKRK